MKAKQVILVDGYCFRKTHAVGCYQKKPFWRFEMEEFRDLGISSARESRRKALRTQWARFYSSFWTHIFVVHLFSWYLKETASLSFSCLRPHQGSPLANVRTQEHNLSGSRKVFHAFDADGDGFLNQQALRRAPRDLLHVSERIRINEAPLAGVYPKPCQPKRFEENAANHHSLIKSGLKTGPFLWQEMGRFAMQTGFDAGEDAWATEYESLCRDHQQDRLLGIDASVFARLVEDQSDLGIYCTDNELKDMLKSARPAPTPAPTPAAQPAGRPQLQPQADARSQLIESAFRALDRRSTGQWLCLRWCFILGVLTKRHVWEVFGWKARVWDVGKWFLEFVLFFFFFGGGGVGGWYLPPSFSKIQGWTPLRCGPLPSTRDLAAPKMNGGKSLPCFCESVAFVSWWFSIWSSFFEKPSEGEPESKRPCWSH